MGLLLQSHVFRGDSVLGGLKLAGLSGVGPAPNGDYAAWVSLEQLKAIGLTLAWSIGGTFILAQIVKVVIGLRPTSEAEEQGLDETDHGEVGYHYGEAGGLTGDRGTCRLRTAGAAAIDLKKPRRSADFMTMAPADDADDSTIVHSAVPAESTVPEPAPARRAAPVAAPPPVRDHRQRRLTVASPIPALLAASMREGEPGQARKDPARPSLSRAEAVPLATVPAQTTSRLAEDLQAELLRDGDDSPEYVVEIDASKPNG